MKKYCLALDLKNDPTLIAGYKTWHQNVPTEILDSLRTNGILSAEIYQQTDRLFMILEVTDEFSFEKKAAFDAASPIVQAWENLMWNYQKALPNAPNGEKWLVMEKIFDFKN